MIDRFLQILICPSCHGHFGQADGKLACHECGRIFSTNSEGFLEFMLDSSNSEKQSTTLEKAEIQTSEGASRHDEEYVLPFLQQEDFERVLDVGCGVGRTVCRLVDEGYEAYGVDLPCLSSFWSEAGNSPSRFFSCDAVNLPFPDDFFDVVISLGVIEHIGTATGHTTLGPGYGRLRQKFADELLRVTRPGGRLLIACPNKSFPIDPQHEVVDEISPRNLSHRVRDRIFRRTGMNIHPVWGRYHLLSYAEMRRLFCEKGRARDFKPLPLRNYFGFTMFESGYLQSFSRLARLWLNRMPAPLRTTFVNPYVIVQIRK